MRQSNTNSLLSPVTPLGGALGPQGLGMIKGFNFLADITDCFFVFYLDCCFIVGFKSAVSEINRAEKGDFFIYDKPLLLPLPSDTCSAALFVLIAALAFKARWLIALTAQRPLHIELCL